MDIKISRGTKAFRNIFNQSFAQGFMTNTQVFYSFQTPGFGIILVLDGLAILPTINNE